MNLIHGLERNGIASAVDTRRQPRSSFPENLAAGAKFVITDRLLDAGATGPRWLLRPAVAECVLQVLLAGEANGQHELGAWVLMPNPVPIVVERQPEVSQM